MNLPTPNIFEDIAQNLGVSEFDLMLIGDGSGTTIEKECAAACFSYDRDLYQVRRHYCTFSHGTNNFAELVPYVHALWVLSYLQPAKELRRIVIISDSEVIVRQGQGRYARNSNTCLWAAIKQLEQESYVITWVHVPRNSNPISTACDRLAKILKKHLTTHQQSC